MKRSEIEPGMLIAGPSGQIREILAVKGLRCHCRQITKGTCTGLATPEAGFTWWCLVASCARWGIKDLSKLEAAV